MDNANDWKKDRISPTHRGRTPMIILNLKEGLRLQVAPSFYQDIACCFPL